MAPLTTKGGQLPLFRAKTDKFDKNDKLETVEEQSNGESPRAGSECSPTIAGNHTNEKPFDQARRETSTEQLSIFKDAVKEQNDTKLDMLTSFQAVQQQRQTESSNSTPLAMTKTPSMNLEGSNFLLPESIAFLIANAVQQRMDQKPVEVTNINNNINIYGQIAIASKRD